MITVTQLHPKHTADDGCVCVASIYLTADHSLMLTGLCAKCGQQVSVLISLTELYKNCPTDTEQKIVEAVDREIRQICDGHKLSLTLKDKAWLKLLKVSADDPPPTPA